MRAHRRRAARFVALWLLASAIVVPPVLAQGGGDDPTGEYVLSGELVPGDLVPDSDLDDGVSGSVVLRIGVGVVAASLCYELSWDSPLDPTAAHVHRVGDPEHLFDLLEVGAKVPATGEEPGAASGCLEGDQGELEYLANEAQEFFVDIHTDHYPDGALGGGLSLLLVDFGDASDEPTIELESFVLQAELTVEHVLPNPPDTGGSADVTLDVTPEHDSICIEAFWEIPDQTVERVHLHAGEAGELGEPLGGNFLVDLGDLFPGGLFGCMSISDTVDFWALVEHPEAFYVDIHTGELPDGALRGQLRFGGEAADFYGDGEHDEEDGRNLSFLVAHVAATLLLAAVAVVAGRSLRRAKGLYDAPRQGSVALTAAAFTLLSTMVVLMWVQWVVIGDVRVGDDPGFAPAATIVILGAASAASALSGWRLARRHPPLRHVGLGLAVVAIPIVLLWLWWWTVLVDTAHF